MTEQREERRQNRRHPLILVVDMGDGNTAWTENVSACGLLLRSDFAIERGAEFKATISFPGALDPVPIVGVVAWTRAASGWTDAGIGVDVREGAGTLSRLAAAMEGGANSEGRDALRVLTTRVDVSPESWGGMVDIVTTGSAEEAAMRTQQHRPNIILTPIFSPVPDCLRMLKSLRQKSEAQIVAMSCGDADDDARAKAAGAVAILPAEIDWDAVIHTLAALQRMKLD